MTELNIEVEVCTYFKKPQYEDENEDDDDGYSRANWLYILIQQFDSKVKTKRNLKMAGIWGKTRS